MATDQEVAEAKNAAQLALFKKIQGMAERASSPIAIGHVARAFRYAAGGPQPGYSQSE